MMTFERKQVATLVDRLNEEPRYLILVSGPRQSGKTTLVRQALARIDYPNQYIAVDQVEYKPPDWDLSLPGFDASEVAVNPGYSIRDARWLAKVWERARTSALDSQSKFALVLDEIQTIPDWSAIVKGLWDADRLNNLPMHVVLLGSAPLVVQRGLTESLLGRFETIHTSHWSFEEMKTAFEFDLDEYLYFGGSPGTVDLVAEPQRWRNYVLGSILEPNIERDILAMVRVDKPALLKRLIELGAEFSGQELSYTKMLGQLDDAGNTTTLARYLDLLEKSSLLAGIRKYEGVTRRLRASSPKLNILNTGLMTALSSYGFQDARSDRTFWGRLVETAVGAHLVNTSTRLTRLHYWRDGTNEVDFVLASGSRRLLVEVKSGSSQHSLRGIKAFEDKYGDTPHILVGSDGMALERFLSSSAQKWLDSA